MNRSPRNSTLLPSPTLFLSLHRVRVLDVVDELLLQLLVHGAPFACVASALRSTRRGARETVRPRAVASRWEVVRTLGDRSEEHTSELQSRQYLVCRLLLEKK